MNRSNLLRSRLIGGITLALVIALSAYILINASKANSVAFASLWFLAVLPAYLCALICYVGDPVGDKPSSFYWYVPPVFGALVVVGSVVFLHEGVICIIMLAPIWLCSGYAGAFILRRVRKGRTDPARFTPTSLSSSEVIQKSELILATDVNCMRVVIAIPPTLASAQR